MTFRESRYALGSFRSVFFLCSRGPHPRSLALRRSKTRYPRAGRRRSLRPRQPFVLFVLFVVSSLISSIGCRHRPMAASESSASEESDSRGGTLTLSAEQIEHGSIRWAAVREMSLANTVQIPGQLMANDDRTARLGASSRGRVVSVHVNAGDRVSAGQLLVTIQSQEAIAARADYSKALAELNARQGAATYARNARDRAARLLDLKAASPQDVERTRADDDVALGAVAQAQAEVERTRAVMSQLGVNDRGEVGLRTPIGGVVLKRDAVPGTVVEAGAPLITVADTRTLWLQAAATERAAGDLRPGARVEFAVPAFPDDKFQAEVQSVGAGLDPATRTLTIRASVQNRSGRLRPEMFATVWVATGTGRKTAAVPDSAVQLLDERPVVFVAQPDASGAVQFQRRNVDVGVRTDGQVEIVKGLRAGELAVIEGAFAVKSEFARSKIPSES
jgi:cobalt-zinc-cadmium efflux system membrane fusion protein